jgi:hypothetical protein
MADTSGMNNERAKRERLARLSNRRTRYELAAQGADGRRVLIAYCARRTRGGLLDACRGRAAQVVALTGSPEIVFGRRAADGATAGAWSIVWTGRTERDAITEGELEFVGA